MDTRLQTTPTPRETQPGEPEASLARRILMFPFARLVVAVGIFLVLQLSLSHGGAAALGDASIAEFVRDHGYVMALFNALAALAAFVVVTKVIERRAVTA